MSSIIRFPESLAIGVHALVYLAGHGEEPGTIAEIARTFTVSADHLAKVLGQLKRMGLVDSVRGPAGGYVLSRPPQEVTLFQVFEAMQGVLESGGCMFREPLCQKGGCPLGQKIRELEREFIAYLKAATLKSFSDSMKNQDPSAHGELRIQS